MRLSVDESDPGYHHGAYLCVVFLAGVQRGDVITADEEGRYALTHRLDEKGSPVVKDGKAQTHEFFGDVRIVAPEWLRAEATVTKPGISTRL